MKFISLTSCNNKLHDCGSGWTLFLSNFKPGNLENNRSKRLVTEQLERKMLCMKIVLCKNCAFGRTISIESILQNSSREKLYK